MRFITWYQLERGGVRSVVAQSMSDKTAAIEDAQRRGTVTDQRTAGELLALVLTVANMWQNQGEDVRGLVPEPERRRVVTDTVRKLVASTH